MFDGKLLFALLTIGASVAVAASADAQPLKLAATGVLEPGLWQLQGDGPAARKICVSDPGALVQLRHANAACSRLVIADERGSAVVHYSCPGAGWGRTTLKVVTPRAVIIDTQGIADNAPFAFTADARRTGDCPVRSAALGRKSAIR